MVDRFSKYEYLRGAALMTSCIIAALFFSWGCGGNSENVGEADKSLNAIGIEHLIYSDSYAGHLVVVFDESLAARLSDDGKLKGVSDDSRIGPIQNVIDEFSRAAVKGSSHASAEKIDERRAYLERLNGRKLTDLNSIYHIEITDKNDAAAILARLRGMPGVVAIYPAVRGQPTGIESTPSLTELQGYLYDEAGHGGLNAEAAWNAGARGQGVYLVDGEMGINFDHADLPLSAANIADGGNVIVEPPCSLSFPFNYPGSNQDDCYFTIAHGTAVAGVVAAKDNGHGVTGFAPDATFIPGLEGFNLLLDLTDGDESEKYGDFDLEPGSIWIVEFAYPGKYSGDNFGSGEGVEEQYGTVPAVVFPDAFAAVEQATAYGVTVIVGAANGQMDLDNDDLYTGEWSFAKNLKNEDSGAMLVGASTGADKSKAFFSNCGSAVDTFAWGLGVVTTGYPYGLFAWEGGMTPSPPNDDPNNFYVNNFGGTSSATAMVGGAAALIQSHAKNQIGKTRYLMPGKIREFLVASGVPQTDGECNIGVQPRIDVAMDLVEDFLNGVESQFPELSGDDMISFDKMVELRQAGVGIVCKKYNPVASDILCPQSEIYPPGNGAADTLDFDSDGRADLVQWTNGPSTGSGQATWKIDLSAYGGSGEDHYGAWDIEIEHDPIDAKWVLPYAEDLNGDGFCDFVVYDKEHNAWYIKYMTIEILHDQGVDGKWEWDKVVTYPEETVYKDIDGKVLEKEDTWHDDRKMDPNESRYSRPVLADISGDEIPDLTIACSDGYWRSDFGDEGDSQYAGFGAYDFKFKYLTDEELEQAPGWAYLTASFPFAPGFEKDMNIYIKVPDGLPDEGRVILRAYLSLEPGKKQDMLEGSPHIYGGNDSILLPGRFNVDESDWGVPSFKDPFGSWKYTTMDSDFSELVEANPGSIYGGPECHPVVADFDGDGYSDNTVMCPDEWKIMYSGVDSFTEARNPNDGVRYVKLGYDESTLSLPGQSYSGGVSYKYTKKLIKAFKILYPNKPPPILVDMVSISSE